MRHQTQNGYGKRRRISGVLLGIALLGVAGCATNGGTAAAPGSGSGGGSSSSGFTAADLKGAYVFSASGSLTDDGNYAVLGSFVADGNGKITSGIADYNFGSGVDSAVLMTGTYAVNAAGTAVLALTDGVAVQDTMTITLSKTGVSTITGYGLNGTGTLTPQSVTGYLPAGDFSYTISGTGQGVVTGSGTFSTGATGVITAGSQIYSDNGRTITQSSNVGFIGFPTTLGRTSASMGGHTYALYIVSPTSFQIISLDEHVLLQGSITKK